MNIGAMIVAAATAVALLVGVEPLNLGLQGVWGGLAILMTSRLLTLLWRYQAADGPLPPPHLQATLGSGYVMGEVGLDEGLLGDKNSGNGRKEGS